MTEVGLVLRIVLWRHVVLPVVEGEISNTSPVLVNNPMSNRAFEKLAFSIVILYLISLLKFLLDQTGDYVFWFFDEEAIELLPLTSWKSFFLSHHA